MRAKSPTPSSEPHTRAWLAFEENLKSVSHLLYMGGREAYLMQAAAARVKAYFDKLGDLKVKTNLVKAARSAGRLAKAMGPRIERYQTANLWQVVMLVTCVEAYLQDVFSAAAGVDPDLMNESQQLAPYADIVAATSLDELADQLRARWARAWLSDGGPTRWISRLERMGARGYPADLAPRLELVWGIRHAAVHAAGVATADFVKRHPGFVKAAGARLRIGARPFGVFLKAVRDFVEPTEKYFVARHPSLGVTGTTGPAK